MVLYRGHCDGEPIGASWTRSRHIARKFALYGWNNVDPLKVDRELLLRPGRPGAVILRAIACAVPSWRLEGEFIVDPRGLEIHSEPAGGADG